LYKQAYDNDKINDDVNCQCYKQKKTHIYKKSYKFTIFNMHSVYGHSH